MTDTAVLALNPGSSSLKAGLRTDVPALSVLVERIDADDGILHVDDDKRPFRGNLSDAVDVVGATLDERGLRPSVVSYRVVHGGPRYASPVVLDDAIVAELEAVVPFAPLHLPGALATLALARRRWPDATHVACFDTGFHRDLPEAARRLPVAAELAELGIRRYGFHGLSMQSVVLRHPDLGDAVVAHLGSGCSVTAVGADGKPRHTTMSLTPTAGMMSATRTGDLDPEIVLYLIEQRGYTPDRLRELVDHHSGFAGIAGGRHDMRELRAADDAAARLALEIFARSAAMAIASCATTLDAWRTLVFTGGIGENDAATREQVCALVKPPPEVSVRVVHADEELVLDHLARELLGLS